MILFAMFWLFIEYYHMLFIRGKAIIKYDLQTSISSKR